MLPVRLAGAVGINCLRMARRAGHALEERISR